MCVRLAGYAEGFVLVGALVSSMLLAAHTTDIRWCRAIMGKMAPSPAFHTLHWFVLESGWAGSYAADVHAIPDTGVGQVDVLDRKYCVGCPLPRGSSVNGFYPSGFSY